MIRKGRYRTVFLAVAASFALFWGGRRHCGCACKGLAGRLCVGHFWGGNRSRIGGANGLAVESAQTPAKALTCAAPSRAHKPSRCPVQRSL